MIKEFKNPADAAKFFSEQRQGTLRCVRPGAEYVVFAPSDEAIGHRSSVR